MKDGLQKLIDDAEASFRAGVKPIKGVWKGFSGECCVIAAACLQHHDNAERDLYGWAARQYQLESELLGLTAGWDGRGPSFTNAAYGKAYEAGKSLAQKWGPVGPEGENNES